MGAFLGFYKALGLSVSITLLLSFVGFLVTPTTTGDSENQEEP